ncbi:hypothetical protein DICPUDRAFT_25851 [Dictyostelium purpureum]|uniref:Mediator of RNA polymerase II transcription subunit 30 n=1 Tax=Dictyostelium purpureum TaxID=5786 RepID=F0Z7K4_DICPU|nr:uncharacterized protein DICPUDRAFT_25851 [Dictyostelium purpureum]EGC40033.1 hypothetical protein DICPUDRAFT_25851 [Dictyostelium purpureum]|eukprot:XP_003283382.1 hypothetical protein DICPUDRAFT_25851 [Dictyostelium purpureum]
MEHNTNINNDFEEELICSLAVKGEKSVHKLLLNVLSIVKYLKTLQSDPVLVYQMSTKEQHSFQANQLQNLQSSNNTSTTSTTTGSANNTATSPNTNKSPTNTSPNTGSHSNINNQSLNLNTSSFLNDNEKIKELNQNCLTSVVALQNIIKDILNLENKITERDSNIENNDSNSSHNNNSQSSLVEELENLKYEAYQKNCTIKKLIDNMRLLQLSINSMNRTSLSD